MERQQLKKAQRSCPKLKEETKAAFISARSLCLLLSHKHGTTPARAALPPRSLELLKTASLGTKTTLLPSSLPLLDQTSATANPPERSVQCQCPVKGWP